MRKRRERKIERAYWQRRQKKRKMKEMWRNTCNLSINEARKGRELGSISYQ